MLRRILTSIAFLLGGAGTVFIVLALSGLAHSQAGMSAVSVSGSSVDSWIPWIAGAYFVLSAISILLARKREGLILAAILSHFVLLILYCAICSEAWDRESGKFWSAVVTLAIIMLVFFSPWL